MKRKLAALIVCILALGGQAWAAEAFITLDNGALRVVVSPSQPKVLSYTHIPTGAEFTGADAKDGWSVTLLRPDRTEVRAQVRCNGGQVFADGPHPTVAYSLDCRDGGTLAVSVVATISLMDEAVVFRAMEGGAIGGYRLLSVDFGKSLRVGLPAGVEGGYVCGGTLGRGGSGSFLLPTDQAAGRSGPLDMVMVGQPGAVAVGFSNLIYQPWRYEAPADASAKAGPALWSAPYVHTVYAGKGDTWTVGEVTGYFNAAIAILGDYSKDRATDWRDGAAYIRDGLRDKLPVTPPAGKTDKPMPLFQDWMRYEASDDFRNFADVVKRLYHVTDGRKQMCLHAGWQYWGWDSEYPAYMEPADELGGRADLYYLMREAPKNRCVVSLIHNWDDAYKHSPAWDEDLIMRREDQSLFEATSWAGGRSFIMGPFKMAKLGWADKVVDGMTAQGARVRLFSDVLSAVPIRVDLDKDMPSDGLANLVLGKYEIIDRLGAEGIIVGSETVTWPFVGRLCTAHSMPLDISDRASQVPLGPFVLHGTMAYQGGRGPTSYLGGVDNTTGWDNERIYLWHMVLAQYANKPMTNYTRADGVFRTEFGPKTFVQWNKPTGELDVVVDGRRIYDGACCLVPKETKNVFLTYSRDGKEHRFARPDGWDDASRVVMHQLSDQPAEKVDPAKYVKFDGDELVLTLPASQPFRLCYGQAAYEADRKLRETPLEPPTITWPQDKLLEASAPDGRPAWVRRRGRPTPPTGGEYVVGCGAKFDTLEQSKAHAASIVAHKIAWAVRHEFVDRSRAYERELGLGADKTAFDQWYLGRDVALLMYSLEKISAREDVLWYGEKLQDNNPQLDKPREAYKAFVAVPVTAEDRHDVYVEAIRYNLGLSRKALDADQGDKPQLEARIKLWSQMLESELNKAAAPDAPAE